jgi:hypothetical protein
MIVHVKLVIDKRFEMVMMQLQPLQHALNVQQLMVIKYDELENDDVQVVHVYQLIVWFHDLKELDQDHVDLVIQMIMNQLFHDEVHLFLLHYLLYDLEMIDVYGFLDEVALLML